MESNANEQLASIGSQEVIDLIENLEGWEKQKVIDHLLKKQPSDVALLRKNKALTNSTTFRLNDSVERISQSLENGSPQEIGKFVNAIAFYIYKHQC